MPTCKNLQRRFLTDKVEILNFPNLEYAILSTSTVEPRGKKDKTHPSKRDHKSTSLKNGVKCSEGVILQHAVTEYLPWKKRRKKSVKWGRGNNRCPGYPSSANALTKERRKSKSRKSLRSLRLVRSGTMNGKIGQASCSFARKSGFCSINTSLRPAKGGKRVELKKNQERWILKRTKVGRHQILRGKQMERERGDRIQLRPRNLHTRKPNQISQGPLQIKECQWKTGGQWHIIKPTLERV